MVPATQKYLRKEGRERMKKEGTNLVCQTLKPVIFLSMHIVSGEYTQAGIYQRKVSNSWGKGVVKNVQKQHN